MEFYRQLFTVFFLCLALSSHAQNYYNIRLEPIAQTNQQMICYEIQLASANGDDFNLGGQNYRMYYNGQKLKFNALQSKNLLPDNKYTNIVIKEDLVDIDARGAGFLDFDDHLSFLNLGNDLKDEENGGITLPSSGEWISTANICFDIMPDNQNIPTSDHSIFWARENLTESYASAYLEVAEWLAPYRTQSAKVATYFDQDLNTSTNETILNQAPRVYPNPTQDVVNISASVEKPLLIQVYNLQGKLVLQDYYPANNIDYSFRMGDLVAGTYYIKLSSQDEFIVKKIERL